MLPCNEIEDIRRAIPSAPTTTSAFLCLILRTLLIIAELLEKQTT